VIDPRTAEHEAAHLVVGCALGLKLRRATVLPGTTDPKLDGYAWFHGPMRAHAAFGVMYAAGIYWESRAGGDPEDARYDKVHARACFKSAADVRTAARLAGEILTARRGVLARVARELLDRDLTAKDVQSLVLDL
jgi:hypothetical protein